jgi:hypothetical protein
MMIDENIIRVLQERIDPKEVLNLASVDAPILGKHLNLVPAFL